MQRMRSGPVGYLLATGLTISLFFTIAHGFGGLNPAVLGIREVSEPITSTTAAEKSGILAWLQSFLSPGIRFMGPATGSKNQAEVLGTANCFNSGAGVSCNGFRNLQEYLAAARVSEDLGIPIEKLKQNMQSGQTLPQAIQDLRPGVNGQIEVMRAEQQARKILKDFSS